MLNSNNNSSIKHQLPELRRNPPICSWSPPLPLPPVSSAAGAHSMESATADCYSELYRTEGKGQQGDCYGKQEREWAAISWYLNDVRGGPSLSVSPISASKLLFSCAARSWAEGPGFEPSDSSDGTFCCSSFFCRFCMLITFFKLAA